MNMQDPALALVAICGFSLICVGLIAVLGFMVLRFTGRSVSGMLGGGGLHGLFSSLSGADDPDDEPSSINRRRRTPAATDLRAQAQSLDFDAAVNQYKNQPLRPTTTSTGTANPFPSAQPQSLNQPDPDTSTSPRRKRRRGSDEDAEGDEMFGGFLDEIDPFQ
jgi:hypothetical protein